MLVAMNHWYGCASMRANTWARWRLQIRGWWMPLLVLVVHQSDVKGCVVVVEVAAVVAPTHPPGLHCPKRTRTSSVGALAFASEKSVSQHVRYVIGHPCC